MKAQTAMTRRLVAIAPADDLDAAWKVMQTQGVRHLPVLDQEVLVGMLSDRDVLLASHLEDGGLLVPSIPVAHAMTPNPMTCAPNTTVAVLAQLMIDCRVDALPVVDGQRRVVGLVSSTDLLDLLSHRHEEADTVLPMNRVDTQHGAGEAQPAHNRSNS